MARKPRINLPGMPYHVIQRGNNREPCFFAEEDYQFYLECLKDALQKYRCDLHAYVLMTNHVHLLITPETDDGLSKVMQSLGRRYVQYVNHVYRRMGTLWEGRFKSSLVDTDNYLLTCRRYIELNPVRAGMVEAPDEYRWSSYRCNTFGEETTLVDSHVLYRQLGSTRDERLHYCRELFRHHLDYDSLHEIRESLNLGNVLGSDYFKGKIEKVLLRSVRSNKVGRPRLDVINEPFLHHYINQP